MMKNKYLFGLLILSVVSGFSQNQDIRRGGGSGGTNSSWGSITGSIANQTDLATALTNKVSKAGDTMTGALILPSSTGALGFTNDVFVQRDAANTLALRNGTNAQAFRVYNTYTDVSNYERASMGWSGNVFTLGTEKLGTGSIRSLIVNSANTLYLNGASNPSIEFQSGGTAAWRLSNAGHFLAATDNTYDIGASGATRPRNVYVGSTIISGSSIASGTYFSVRNNNSFIDSASYGVVTFTDNSGVTFYRLNFGGTTTNYPAITTVTNSPGRPYLAFTDATGANYIPIAAGGVQGGYTKVCTSASSNALFYVSVPNTNMIGGRVLYIVNSTDGTDSQQITGTTQFGAVGKSTTVTANVTDVQNTSTVSAGTLTATITANVSTNNVFAFMITPTTSLTTTNLTVKWRLETPSTYTVNPL